jgi:AraC-like DNA-binding protein
MKIQEVRLFNAPGKSFIWYQEKDKFHEWHHHPEYELVLITAGKGIRIIGDHIDRFEENDLVLLGPHLPHEWRINAEFFQFSGDFIGEAIVIQFLPDSFGERFFELPENINLREILTKSLQGLRIYGGVSVEIISIMKRMFQMNDTQRLYALFSIFNFLSFSKEYRLLSSPVFCVPFRTKENEPLQKVVQYILQNFQKDIKISDLLQISNMSRTTFFIAFKRTYGMTCKKYLLRLKVGYACRLLGEGRMNISQIAYESGFENMSNFNRRFKIIKDCSPKEYRMKINKS